jgi:REP element-mobilizing transposase RayT
MRFASKPAHVTVKVRPGVPSLRSVALVREVERSFAQGCKRPGFRLVHYSLQGNHAHLVVEAHSAEALGRGMKAVGSRLARAVNRVFKRTGPVFQERYHLHVLTTPKEVRAALRYVLLNSRRHARRLTSMTHLDPASSARWFDGWRRGSVPGNPSPPSRPPVARARTWLLSMGWRRPARGTLRREAGVGGGELGGAV